MHHIHHLLRRILLSEAPVCNLVGTKTFLVENVKTADGLEGVVCQMDDILV